MTVLSQASATISTVIAILGDAYQPGKAVTLTKEQREDCIQQLVSGFQEGQIAMKEDSKAKFQDPKDLRKYCSGLLTNWMNKSPELNGNIKYEAKNPGSRSRSPELKAALALKESFEKINQEVPQELQEYIDSITPAPASTKKELDVSALPEELQALAKLTRVA